MSKHTFSFGQQQEPIYHKHVKSEMVTSITGKKVYNNQTYYKVAWVNPQKMGSAEAWVMRTMLQEVTHMMKDYNKRHRAQPSIVPSYQDLKVKKDIKELTLPASLGSYKLSVIPPKDALKGSGGGKGQSVDINSLILRVIEDKHKKDLWEGEVANLRKMNGFHSVDIDGNRWRVMGIRGHIIVDGEFFFQLYLQDMETKDTREGAMLSFREVMDVHPEIIECYMANLKAGFFI